jgi:hypothetical protein
LQGSGKDCRLYVQQLNSLKANEIFSVISERYIDDNYNASASVPRDTHNGKAAESKWAKYLDSPQKENLFHAQCLSPRDIREAKDLTSNEKFPCDDANDDLCNTVNILDNSNSEIESITDDCETKNLQSTNPNHNSDSVDKRNLQVNSKFNDFINIFETNEELGECLEL